jgi:hypothetical protein
VANPHAGHKRGFGAPLVVGALLVAGGLAAVHLMAPVHGTYRDVGRAVTEPGAERSVAGEAPWLEADGRLWVRVRLRRTYPVLGPRESTERWDRARFTEFRRAEPTLAAREDYWPDAARPDGGVLWAE